MCGQMMGAMSKVDDELITLTIRGDGPIGGVTVTANNRGQAKGFANHPDVELPLREDGHLDVSAAVGAGELSVVFDQPGVAPYSSQVELVSGEIGVDLTNYFVLSDQVPSSVGVGVLVGPGGDVRQAGGFMIQLMPGHTDDVTEILERNLANVTSVTDLFERGMRPRDVLAHLLRDLDFEELDAMGCEFHCGCDESRAARCVVALGTAEIEEMVETGEACEVYCHFCGRRHYLTTDDLKSLLEGEPKGAAPVGRL
jgi:molecular chaperone Hsp33